MKRKIGEKYFLAVKLDEFADDWDPYGYMDAFSTRIEGIENFMVGLKEDTQWIIDWLTDIIDECKEWNDPAHNAYLDKANKLIEEVNKWTSKI